MQGVLRQQLQFVEGIVETAPRGGTRLWTEGTVGIDAQLQLARAEALAQLPDEVQLLVEADGAYFQLDAAEALLQLLFHALQHLVVVAHPHQAVDGYALLAAGEGRVE